MDGVGDVVCGIVLVEWGVVGSLRGGGDEGVGGVEVYGRYFWDWV